MTHANPEVSVGRPVVIHGHDGITAIVVSLDNQASHAVTDLPISVGVRIRPGRRAYLNESASADYFQSHVASIGPSAATTWVFTTGRRLRRGRVFATVGLPALRTSVAGSLPRIVLSSRPGRAPGIVTVAVRSRSAIPQYDLPVYVVAVRSGRHVAAGQATVAHLGTEETTMTSVHLIGDSRQATLQLIALPTIFR